MTFAECDTPMLRRLLVKYEAEIERIDSGQSNAACGGSRLQCVRWRNAVRRELAARGEAVVA